MAKKDTTKTVINRGAIVAKQTKKAPEQGAISAPKQKNIQSAQGNTSNAFTPKVANRPTARDEETSARVRADWENRKDQIKNQIAEYNRRGGGLSDEVRARNEAGQKQTQTREKYDKLPSLDDFTSQSVFTGANKHFNDGRTNKERMYDMLEGLAIGSRSYINEITARDFMKDTLGIDPVTSYINNKPSGVGDLLKTGQTLSDALYEAKRDEHKAADTAGKMVGKAQEYATVNALAETIPALQTAKEFLTSKLGGSIHAENIANALIDYGITDLPLDTVPEIRENIKAGKSTSEIITDALKNFGINTAFNLGLGYLGNIGDLVGARRAFKGQKDALQEIAQRGKNGAIQLPNIADDIKPGISNQIVPNELDELVPTERLLDINGSRNALNVTRPNVMDELVPNRDTAMQMADSLRQTGWEPQTQQLDMLGNPARQYEVPEPKVYKDTSVDGFRRESTSLRRSVDQYGGDPEKYQNIFKLLNEYQDTGNEDLLKQAHDLSVALDGELTGKVVKRGKATYDYNEGSYISKVDDLIDKLSNGKRYEQFSNTEVTGADLKYPINSLRERASKALDPEGVNKSLDEFISNLNEVVAKNDAESWNKVQESFNKVLQSDATMRSNGEAVAQEMFTMIDRVEDMTKTGAKAAAESVSEPTLTGTLDEVAPTIKSEVNADMPQGVSQYYENTLRKTTDPETFESNYKDLATEDTYNIKSNDWKQDVANRRIAEDGTDVWFDRLVNAEEMAAEDLRTAYALKQQFEATDPIKAQQLQRAIRPHITNSAQNLNELAQQAKTVPEAQLEYGLARARKIVDDKKKMPGFSDAINKMADNLESAIENGNLEKAKEIVKQELSNYGTGQQAKAVLSDKFADGEQMVLDLIGGYSPDKKSLKELAEEAASLMRKQNGVADFSAKDEAEILNILKMQSEFEKGSMQYKEYQSLAASYIDSKMPVGIGEKIKTVLYDNMLGNLRTMLTRNAGGNLFANSLEKMQKPLKVGIDKAVSGKTGVRNYIFDKQIASAYTDGFKKGVADQWHDLKTKINTTRSGEEELINALDNVHKTFKGQNNLSKFFGEYDRIVKGTMGMGDRPFYEAEYAAAKKELELIRDKFGEKALQKVGVPASDLVKSDSIIEFWARNRALDACFQNGTLTSNALTKAKEAIGLMGEDLGGAAFGKALQQSSMPFTQVAGNMFSRFTDYIPLVGSAKNLVNTGAEVLGKGPGLNQKRFVDATSRNILGYGLGGLGFGLAKNAADGGDFGITGGYSDDASEKAAQIAAGFQPYSVQVPWFDGSVRQFNIDDIPVLGPMTEATSNAYESYQENKDDPLGAIASGIGGGISSAVSNSMLQGLNRMFGSNQYSNNGSFGQNLMDVAYSLPGQMVPSLVRQVSQVADPYKRDLGDYNSKGRYAINSMLNSTPGRFALNPKVDSEGLPVLQNQGRGYGSKILENMVLPWSMSEPQYSDLVQIAQDIKNNSSNGTSQAFPGLPARSTVKQWMGDNYSESSYYNIKKQVGELNGEIGNQIISEDWFKELPADERANVLNSAYTTINDIVRYNNDADYESTNTLGNIYRNEGPEAFMEELKTRAILDSKGVSDNKASRSALESGKIDDYVAATEFAKENGLDGITESEWKDYDKFGSNYFEDEVSQKGLLNSYDLPQNETTKTLLDAYGEKELPYIKQASDEINSIVKGTDKWGDETYQSLTTKLYDIWKDNGGENGGKKAAQTFIDMLAYDGDKDGKSGSKKDMIPYLQKSNLPISQQEYFIEKASLENGELSDTAKKFKKENSTSGVLDYYTIKTDADGMGVATSGKNKGKQNEKNGNLSQSEYIAYMSGNKKYSKAVKEAYFRLLFPDAKKIPAFD